MAVQRYSIYKVTSENKIEVDAVGQNVTFSPAIGAAFADLNDLAVAILTQKGFKVTPVRQAGIQPSEIKPSGSGGSGLQLTPVPVAPGAQTYTMAELLDLAGNFEAVRMQIDPPPYGAGVVVAMLDTGIRKTHDGIRGHVVLEEDFSGSGDTDDHFDHGTGVAGIILTAAPECSLLNFKILNNVGAGSEENVVMAIERILEMHDEQDPASPWIVNISAGAEDIGDPNDVLRVACRELINRGVFIMAAAGNSGPDGLTIASPACEQYVGAVGSVSPATLQVSSFSSRGPTKQGLTKPDSTFYGESVLLMSNASDTAMVAKSGTSFSAPFLSGLLALTRELFTRPFNWVGGTPPEGIPTTYSFTGQFPPQELIDTWLSRISVKAKEGFTAGKDNQVGWGMPFGTLFGQAVTTPVEEAQLTAIIGPMMMMMMIGMMAKVMKTK